MFCLLIVILVFFYDKIILFASGRAIFTFFTTLKLAPWYISYLCVFFKKMIKKRQKLRRCLLGKRFGVFRVHFPSRQKVQKSFFYFFMKISFFSLNLWGQKNDKVKKNSWQFSRSKKGGSKRPFWPPQIFY